MAYSQAPIVVTALMAALMSKAGVYGLLRVGVPIFPEGANTLLIPIAILALTESERALVRLAAAKPAP
jgi:NADH:ubiquinone oxidoreductase subunit 4 (subunit M)